jgi:hypothetical protein
MKHEKTPSLHEGREGAGVVEAIVRKVCRSVPIDTLKRWTDSFPPVQITTPSPISEPPHNGSNPLIKWGLAAFLCFALPGTPLAL